MSQEIESLYIPTTIKEFEINNQMPNLAPKHKAQIVLYMMLNKSSVIK